MQERSKLTASDDRIRVRLDSVSSINGVEADRRAIPMPFSRPRTFTAKENPRELRIPITTCASLIRISRRRRRSAREFSVFRGSKSSSPSRSRSMQMPSRRLRQTTRSCLREISEIPKRSAAGISSSKRKVNKQRKERNQNCAHVQRRARGFFLKVFFDKKKSIDNFERIWYNISINSF